MNPSLSYRMSSALSLWAAILVLLTGLWAGLEPSTLLMRCALGSLIFWILGYSGGLLITRMLKVSKDTEASKQGDQDAGKAMEGV